MGVCTALWHCAGVVCGAVGTAAAKCVEERKWNPHTVYVCTSSRT